MSDKKSKKSADLEANLARIANAKPRRRSRKDNIYERFITRVENVDSTDNDADFEAAVLKPLKNADKLFSYEPLSTAELELFTIQQEDLQQEASLQGNNSKGASSKSSAVNLDFADEDERLDVSNAAVNRENLSSIHSEERYADASNDTIVKEAASINNTANYNSRSSDIDGDIDDLAAQSSVEPVPSTDTTLSKESTLASSKKALIIGIIVGSLLIAAVVVTLIFTGVLSTTSEPALSTDASTPNGHKDSDSDKADTAKDNLDTSNQPTVDSQTNVPNSGNRNANNKPPADKNKTDNVKGTSRKPTAETTGATGIEPAITYEDFRQESQSTLYRETND
ncbi:MULTISPECIES: hypothetical protein [unclassified Psychrobacter]|uniref:hypothetical protein n=1 Tax=unclassified Psychrobacter TaxID=196806 RepID=UPI0025E52ECD|nr:MULTISPECIES: hypothetical protein [unclassified Psychrobacter]